MIPGVSESVTIEVEFAEGDVLQQATLSYIVNSGSQNNVAMQGEGNVFSGEIPRYARNDVNLKARIDRGFREGCI